MERITLFTQHQPLLFAIAYRMLGSVMDAEDMVQETFLRWQQAAAVGVHSPKAYLMTIVTRLCIDHLRTAHVQREAYYGLWLPEPLVTEQLPSLTDSVVLAESLSLAFLVLLERLSPVERAVFLLRDVFAYEYADIACIVDKTVTNCRQMVRRARHHLAEQRPRFAVMPAQQERLTAQFIQTCMSGDMDGLLTLLAENIVLYSDGGGTAGTARRPIYGHAKVLRLIGALFRKAPGRLILQPGLVNGQPGCIAYINGQPQGVLTAVSVDGCIQTLYMIVNPDKLQRVPRLA